MFNKNKGKLITISDLPAGAVEIIIKLLITRYENCRTAMKKEVKGMILSK